MTREDSTKEIEDLKTRLSMGAEEYKKKYLECKALEVKYEKMRKTQTKRDSVGSVTSKRILLNEFLYTETTSM